MYANINILIFLFLNQNIRCGYSKEPLKRGGSSESPEHIIMLKLLGKKIVTNLRLTHLLNLTFEKVAK